MPNFVDNWIEMSGPEEQIKELQEKFKEKDFSAFFPIPEEKKLKEKGYEDWYDFAIKTWGTKGLYPETLCISNKYIGFVSAWSPAIPFTINLSKLYPKIKFVHTYREESEPEVHTVKIQNGKILKDYSKMYLQYEDIDLFCETKEETEEFFEELKSLVIENEGRAIIFDENFNDIEKATARLEEIKEETLKEFKMTLTLF